MKNIKITRLFLRFFPTERQNKVEERFVDLKYPHEIVPIDDLHFYRRRALPGTFTGRVFHALSV